MFRHLLLVALIVGALSACEDGNPLLLHSVSYSNPGGTWSASLEEIDNGLGFGQGAIYREVHLLRRGEPAGEHGDSGSSVVFYAESTYGKGKDVTVDWLSDRRVRIRYDPMNPPGKHSSSYRDVNIEVIPYDGGVR